MSGPSLGTAGLINGFLDLFFPRRCVQCGSVGSWFCLACERGLRGELWRVETEYRQLAFFDFAEPGVRELLHHLKYNGLWEIGSVLVGLAAKRTDKLRLRQWLGETVLIPVPTTAAKQKVRGYNQAEVIARALGEWLELPVWAGALATRRGWKRSTQVGKSALDREEAAHERFVWRGRAEMGAGKSWTVVDDLMTTGSTLAACRDCLRPHTLGRIQTLAVARVN